MKEQTPTPHWIRHAPLEDVCLTIAHFYQQDKCMLRGSIFAELAKRLIQAEVRPGGPYHNNKGVVDLFTNISVGYLLECLGTPLLNVTEYIARNRNEGRQSPELLALLKKYDHLSIPPSPSKQPAQYARIFARAAAQLSLLDEPAKTPALKFLDRIKRADTSHEIALLPTFFTKSLKEPPTSLPLMDLGEANIYCWIAYTIYDHILDGEPVTSSLSIANIAMRLSLSKYQAQLPFEHPFQQKINHVFTGMDLANTWEVTHCRYKLEGTKIHIGPLPDYAERHVLADRSLGHILGPLAIMQLDHLPTSNTTYVEKGFRHYLIARQLSDDAHDWKEDLRAGHCSAVVASMLKSCHISTGVHPLEPLINQMQSDFWGRSLKAVNDLIQEHVALSRQLFRKSGVIKEPSPLFNLLSRLDNAAICANLEHERYKDFATTYRKIS